MRKQTLANAERFITQELQEYETRVFQAEEQIEALEYQLFREVLAQVARELPSIQESAQNIAEIDVLAALAEVADRYGYIRPKVDEGETLSISEGRHPVLERIYG
jgi:DNA mismatch repair protein MutS